MPASWRSRATPTQRRHQDHDPRIQARGAKDMGKPALVDVAKKEMKIFSYIKMSIAAHELKIEGARHGTFFLKF